MYTVIRDLFIIQNLCLAELDYFCLHEIYSEHKYSNTKFFCHISGSNGGGWKVGGV